MREPAKSTRSTSKLTQWHPLVTTPILCYKQVICQSFQKGPPKKTCGKCGCSHSHGECPTFGTTCNICGKKNHWAQQCRNSGRRHSLSGWSPSPGKPKQQRQRRHSSKPFNKSRGSGGGGSSNKNSTPKKPGAG